MSCSKIAGLIGRNAAQQKKVSAPVVQSTLDLALVARMMAARKQVEPLHQQSCSEGARTVHRHAHVMLYVALQRAVKTQRSLAPPRRRQLLFALASRQCDSVSSRHSREAEPSATIHSDWAACAPLSRAAISATLISIKRLRSARTARQATNGD